MRYDPNKCVNILLSPAVLHNFELEVGHVFQADEIDLENEPYITEKEQMLLVLK